MSDSDVIPTEPSTITNPPAPANPFQGRSLGQHVNAGTVAIEEARAVAEAQGKLVIAKRFLRDPVRAYNAIMEACKRPGLAAIAEYSFPRGTERVTGPSIRLAEELARCWGNIDYGVRELSRRDGVSEMEAYAWDLETNTMSSQKFTVNHVRDTRNGPKKLSDERDVYELTANMAGRRLRARIMAILPADIVEAAVQECRKTLAGNNTRPMVDRVRALLEAFGRHGVTLAMVERWLEKPVADMLPEELAELTAIGNSIKDGVAKAGDYFDMPKSPEAAAVDNLNDQIRQQSAAVAPVSAPSAPAPPAAPKPAAQPAQQPAPQPAARPTPVAGAPVQPQENVSPAQGVPPKGGSSEAKNFF